MPCLVPVQASRRLISLFNNGKVYMTNNHQSYLTGSNKGIDDFVVIQKLYCRIMQVMKY